MNNWFKQNGTHLAIIGIFIVLSFAYFFTPLTQGKVLYQSDVVQARAMQKEIMDVKAKTGKAPLWTNQMFGGMPSFQIWAPYPDNVTTYVIEVLKAVFPNPVDTVLLYMAGMYLLLCVLGLNPWLAAAGSIGFAFSSYNFIYIEAGHANQAYAIAFFAPVLAGILLTLRGRYLLGASVTALALALEIRSNHIQMTYYLLLAILILIGIELYHAIKGKQTAAFSKSIGYLVCATLLAVLVNAGMLWTTYQYGKETIRGKSNLTQHTTEPSNGLSKEYAYQYSQGVGECFTFLIPNAYGGGNSTPVSEDSKVVKTFTDKGIDAAQAQSIAQQLPLYWGDKPIAGGPWYFGAVICFLFIFGLIVVKSRLKWWLLAAALLSIFLSFGRNLPFLSDLFFNYFPLYNKFRTVESTLVIACLVFPILACLAVQEAINAQDKTVIFKRLKLALYITGGLTLIMIAAPEVFLSFRSSEHQNFINYLTQAFKGDAQLANQVASSLVQDRIAIERSDAIRSFVFIVLAFGIIWAYLAKKAKATYAVMALGLLVLIDMWGIDRRYLKDENFISKDELAQPFPPREVDQFILRDPDPDYRVFDMTQGDPFASAAASYYHKTIGGYHAAKLKRYQELIENQFTKSINQDVLDMLNTKYIITTDPKTQSVGMHANSTACGHAWFVKSVKFADNADQEMQAISAFSPKDEAIVDKRYQNLVDEKQHTGLDTAAKITLVSYEPDHLVYQSGSTTPQVAVFSEIYYDKGWKMLIDGEEKPYFRADYILRAAQIPVGNHKVEFVFHPTAYYAGEKISLAGSLLLVLALGGAAYAENKKKKKKK